VLCEEEGEAYVGDFGSGDIAWSDLGRIFTTIRDVFIFSVT